MRVLVIGGAGYIGSHVVLALNEAGYDVRVLDNLSTGQTVNLFDCNEFIKGDILDTKAVFEALQGVDAVIHLAAKKSVFESMSNPNLYARNNINGTLTILNAMADQNIRLFVFSSSAAVYGIPNQTILTETAPTQPINFYGFTKLEIERFLKWYDQLKKIKFISLRYFNAVGYDETGRIQGLEKNPQNLLPIIMETAAGIRPEMTVFGTDYNTPDGSCIRDYIHVTDLAAAHIQALQYLQEKQTSRIFNLGTGTGHSVLEMIERARILTQKPIPYQIGERRTGDPAILTACADLAKQELKWQPRHSSLDTIITSTWQLYHSL